MGLLHSAIFKGLGHLLWLWVWHGVKVAKQWCEVGPSRAQRISSLATATQSGPSHALKRTPPITGNGNSAALSRAQRVSSWYRGGSRKSLREGLFQSGSPYVCGAHLPLFFSPDFAHFIFWAPFTFSKAGEKWATECNEFHIWIKCTHPFLCNLSLRTINICTYVWYVYAGGGCIIRKYRRSRSDRFLPESY